MRRHGDCYPITRRQRGAVLVISLIILLMLTIIGVTGAHSVLLQEKMTFASRDAHLALQVAEATTREAERQVEALLTTADFVNAGTGGKYASGSAPSDLTVAASWAAGNSVAHSVTMDGKTFSGRYFIELAGNAEDIENVGDVDVSTGSNGGAAGEIKVFKVVARGVGLAGTERFLITYYGKRI